MAHTVPSTALTYVLQDTDNDGDFGTDRHFAAVVCQIWALVMGQVSKELLMCRAVSYGEGWGGFAHWRVRDELCVDAAYMVVSWPVLAHEYIL